MLRTASLLAPHPHAHFELLDARVETACREALVDPEHPRLQLLQLARGVIKSIAYGYDGIESWDRAQSTIIAVPYRIFAVRTEISNVTTSTISSIRVKAQGLEHRIAIGY